MSTRSGRRLRTGDGADAKPAAKEPAPQRAEAARPEASAAPAATKRTEKEWLELEASVTSLKREASAWAERCKVVETAQQVETAEVKRLREQLREATAQVTAQKKLAQEAEARARKGQKEADQLRKTHNYLSERCKALEAQVVSGKGGLLPLPTPPVAATPPQAGSDVESLRQQLASASQQWAFVSAALMAETAEVKRLRAQLEETNKADKVGGKRKRPSAKPSNAKTDKIVDMEVDQLVRYFNARCETYTVAAEMLRPGQAGGAIPAKSVPGLPPDMFEPQALASKVVYAFIDQHNL